MKGEKVKNIFFWIVTALLSFELVYGALWDFNVLNKGYVYEMLKHLGYPLYIAVILGVAKLAATVVILLPGFPLEKEWAYTGVVILFTGAFASHQFSGDSMAQSGFALGFAVIGLLSWILRPEGRRL
jgi:DoxX-like family